MTPIQKTQKCPRCHGAGKVGKTKRRCPVCKGEGEITTLRNGKKFNLLGKLMPNYLIDLAPANFKGTILFHDVSWFAAGKHRAVGHVSDDQKIVDLKLDLIQKYGKGFPAAQLGVIEDWYGFKGGDSYIDPACLKMLASCEKRGMKYMQCFDKGISKTGLNQDMLDAVAYTKAHYFGSPSYMKDKAGKLMAMEFAASYADWNGIAIQYGLHMLHWKNDKANGYAWIKPSQGANAHATLVSDNAQVFMPAVSPGFDDHKFDDPTTGVWGAKPARKADYENGALWLAAWKSIPADTEVIEVVTFTDFEERTSIAGNLGFPGLPADLYLPLGSAIPNVFSDPLPSAIPLTIEQRVSNIEQRLSKAGIP
jgi:hypothetical protein